MRQSRAVLWLCVYVYVMMVVVRRAVLVCVCVCARARACARSFRGRELVHNAKCHDQFRVFRQRCRTRRENPVRLERVVFCASASRRERTRETTTRVFVLARVNFCTT